LLIELFVIAVLVLDEDRDRVGSSVLVLKWFISVGHNGSLGRGAIQYDWGGAVPPPVCMLKKALAALLVIQ